jgi:hypothetical protein
VEYTFADIGATLEKISEGKTNDDTGGKGLRRGSVARDNPNASSFGAVISSAIKAIMGKSP